MGTLDDIGYNSGLNVSIPVGWHKRGSVIGVRTEWGIQSFDGRNNLGFSNPDARFYSAVGLLTVNLAMNAAKTNTFYLMGGGGVYMFRNLTAGSTLGDRFGATTTAGSTSSETKFGFQGGAGVELKILGATSLFVQTGISQVSVDTPPGTSGSSLRWVPLIAGVQLR
jgi:opacity protein-like surface antigen